MHNCQFEENCTQYINYVVYIPQLVAFLTRENLPGSCVQCARLPSVFAHMWSAAARFMSLLRAEGRDIFEPPGQDGRRCQWLAVADQIQRKFSINLTAAHLDAASLEDGMACYVAPVMHQSRWF